MKRLAAFFLAALFLLSGCGKPEAEQTLPSTVATTAAPETTSFQTVPALTEPETEDAFVRVADYLPGVFLDLRYATEDNFTGQRIYDFADAYLRWGTVKKLMAVSRELWEVCPDPTFVANPETGYSSHSRGNTVDLTLVNSQGQELEMPTGFDDFTALADRDYSDCPETAAANARALEELMERHGFSGYFGEWWHFSDTQTYPVELEFTPPA